MTRRKSWLAVVICVLLVPRAAWPQAGTPLGPEFRVNTYNTAGQWQPSIAADPSGNFVVLWSSYDQDGSVSGVYGQRFAGSGVPSGPEFRVNSYTTSHQKTPAVATDAAGNFVVVWEAFLQDGSDWGIFGQRYASSGGPLGPEFRVNTSTAGKQSGPIVAATPSGDFVVAWNSFYGDGSSYAMVGQRYAASGMPLGSEFRINTYTTSSQVGNGLAIDPQGNVVAIWDSFGQDGSSWGVYGQRFAPSGTPLGPEFRVNEYTTYGQYAAKVRVDTSGNFLVVWSGKGPAALSSDVFGQRYASMGIPLGPQFRVNTYTTDYQRFPSVALDGSGNFVVVWDSWQQDGSATGIFAQRFASDGVPLGPEFRVNSTVTNHQAGPSVAADAAGNFVIVWTDSLGAGTSSEDVYGQRYSQIVPVELMQFRVE